MTGWRSSLMTNDLMLGGLYILMAVMLVLGALMSRREPAGKAADHGAGLDRDLRRRLRPVHVPRRSRLGRAAAEGRSDRRARSAGPRNPHPDGDRRPFLGRGEVNGETVKFLVDSGATMTTIGRDTAAHAGVRGQPRAAIRSSAPATASSACQRPGANSLQVGDIERDDVGVHIADDEDLNVLGMNFLSSLSRWGVEGRWLVLVSLTSALMTLYIMHIIILSDQAIEAARAPS